MQLVYEDLNSFIRNQDPLKSLSLGYEGKIRDFFRKYRIHDENYEVKETGEIVFNTYLNLFNAHINELPNNLTINGWLDLRYTNITEIPNDLIVRESIHVNKDQIGLIKFIKQSKFKNQLTIWNI